MPKSIALLIAFAISGTLHDLAIGLVKNWQCFFTIWFTLMGLFLLLSKKLQISYSQFPFFTRMAINILSLSACFLAARVLKRSIFL